MAANKGGGVEISFEGPFTSVVERLTAVLESTDAGRRAEMARAILDRPAKPADWRQRVPGVQIPAVARAFAQFGGEAPPAFRKDLASRFSQWARSMPGAVVRGVADGFPAGPIRGDIGEALMDALRSGEEDAEREKAMEVLCVVEPREVMTQMISVLKTDPNPHVRRLQALLLGALKEQVEAIAHAHDHDPDEEVRFSCLMALGLGSHPLGLQKILEAGESDDASGVIMALMSHKSPGAGAALLERAFADPGDVLIEATAADLVGADDDPEPEWPDLSPLKTPALVTRALKFLKGRDDDKRCIALLILGALRADEATEALIKALGDSDSLLQAEAANALGRLKAEAAIPALIPLAMSLPEASRALARLQATQSIPALAKVLARGREAGCRVAAAKALGALGGSEAEEGLLKGLHDREARVRAASVEAFSVMKSARGEDVRPLLKDRTASVRCAAVRAAGDLGLMRCLDDLITLSKDRAEGVRPAALTALWRLSQMEPAQDRVQAPKAAPSQDFLRLLLLPWRTSVDEGTRMMRSTPDPETWIAALLDFHAAPPNEWVSGALKRQEPLSFVLGSRADLSGALRGRLVHRMTSWVLSQPYPPATFVLSSAEVPSRLTSELTAGLTSALEATPDPGGQSMLVAGLQALPPSVTLASLQPLLRHRSRNVRRGAASVLVSYRDAESRAALKRSLKDRDYLVRAVALGALSPTDEPDVRRLALMSKDPSTEVRIDAVLALAGINSKTSNRYLEQIGLRNARTLVRLTAFGCLAARDRAFVPRFLEALNASFEDRETSNVLERIEDSSGFIADGLRAMNRDGPTDLEQNASWFLEMIERRSDPPEEPGAIPEKEVANLIQEATSVSSHTAIVSLWRLIDEGRLAPAG